MNRDELTLEIQEIAREIFAKPELEINDAMGAADVDTWTSLSFMQFLTAVEDKYGFKFKMMELLQLRNMGAVIDAVCTHTHTHTHRALTMNEIRLYTVADLKAWLIQNKAPFGLSEQVIAPVRAWAIINNPYVNDDDAIAAAIFEYSELAAYSASFPDMLDGKRVWWASTLYCYPKFAGRGYGLIVIGALMEAHEPELTYDRWGGNETVEICNHLGLITTYSPRYYLKDKSFNTSTLRGNLASLLYSLKKCLHPKKLSRANYSLRYATYIDGGAHAFMKEHRCNDLWLRELEMLNWILSYPMWQGCTMPNRVEKDLEFTANTKSFDYKVVKVYVEGTMQGVYVLRRNGDSLSVIYLYYTQEHRDVVFASVVDHVIIEKPICVSVESKELRDYIQNELQFPKSEEEQISFSIPRGVMIPETTYTLQFGDGDSFM